MGGDSLFPRLTLPARDARPPVERLAEERAEDVLADPGDGGAYLYTVVVSRSYADGGRGRGGVWVYRRPEQALDRYEALTTGDLLPGEHAEVSAYRSRLG